MKRALLISLQGIGNTVLMAPAVRLLAEAGYRIDLVVSDNGSHEILRTSPYVNEQHLWIEADGWLRNLLRLRSKLRLVEYETAYALYPNGRRENALLSLTRAAHKKCYVDRKHYYQFLNFLPFSDKVEFHRQHDTVSNLNLVRNGESHAARLEPGVVRTACVSGWPDDARPPAHASGSDMTTAALQVPHGEGISLPEEAEEFAAEFYESHGLADRFVVSVHPGGGNSAKQWSAQNYSELCAKLSQRPELRLLVFGAKSEAQLVDKITGGLGDQAVAVCGLDLPKVSAILRRSRLLIGNDSALIHIASAFDIPVVAIWGYTDFYRTAPFSSKGILVRVNYACSPCYDFASGYIDDCQYHLKCIKNISVETVHRIVTNYITLLTNRRPLEAREFEREPFVESIERLDGQCLMINVRAASEASLHA